MIVLGGFIVTGGWDTFVGLIVSGSWDRFVEPLG